MATAADREQGHIERIVALERKSKEDAAAARAEAVVT